MMKKANLRLMAVVILIVLTFSVSAFARLYDGSGTEAEPFIIDSAAKMNDIGDNQPDWGLHFKLTADIDLGGYVGDSFNLIGYSYYYDEQQDMYISMPFTGVFDGNGHTISNFTYTRIEGDGTGLFGSIDGELAEVKNLGLIDPNINTGNGWEVGALVGYLLNGKIQHCYVEGGSVKGYETVGGMVGWKEGNSIITDCYTNILISGTDESTGGIGGLVGVNWSGKISNCYTKGNNSGYDFMGGLVGGTGSDSVIEHSFSIASVSGSSFLGGLVGANRGKILDCYAQGDVSGTSTTYGRIGGLVGLNTVGYQSPPAIISNCYSTGNVSGLYYTGGLVGKNEAVVESSFWDVNTSGQTTSSGGVGKITSEMKDPNTFILAGWDFDTPIWASYYEDDYPKLAWEPYPGPAILSIIPEPNSLLMSSNVNIDVKFNKEVFGVDVNDIVLSNTAAIGVTVDAPVDLGNNVWRFPVTGLSDGILDVNLCQDEGDIIDEDGLSLQNPPKQWGYEVFVLTPILDEEPEVILGTGNTIFWDSVSNADMYYVECSNEPNFSTITDSSDWIYDLEFDFADLNIGQTYWYRAKARTAPDILTWLQTSQEDFETSTLENIRVDSIPGSVVLAKETALTVTEEVGGTRYNGGRGNPNYITGGRFNFFECTSNCTLKEIRQRMFHYSGKTVQFVVYEAMEQDGQYEKIHSNSVTKGYGVQWSNSHGISVPLIEGRYYAIGVVGKGNLYYYDFGGNNILSWGTRVGSGGSSYPAPDTLSYANRSLQYGQRLTTEIEPDFYPAGNIVASAIDLCEGGSWADLEFSITQQADTNLTVDVLDASDDSVIIADANDGENLSWIGVNSIKLKANLSTDDPDVTPALHDWMVTYTDPTTIIESDWSNVVWSMQGTLGDAVEVMLDPNSLKNANMANALSNKIDEVLEMIEAGLYEDALKKLENDILKKTDGCADANEPDKNDWIKDCEEQRQIYPFIMETIEYVSSLLE